MNKKIMKNYKNNVYFYFKDAYSITFIIIGLLLLGFILTFFNGKAWTNWNLILLILAFTLPLFELPMIVFSFKVLHDFKQNCISEKEITVQKIYTNPKHNIQGRYGGYTGDVKYILLADNGKEYVFCPRKSPNLSSKPFNAKIVYCLNTNFLLSFKIDGIEQI
ncbi:MAG: hypothetical protein ACI4II_03835 [Acutalibacteraceae bacterium]